MPDLTPHQRLLTLDIEDWASDFPHQQGFEPRLRQPFSLLLDLLAEHRSTATLFFLVASANECPDLVRRAVAAGHRVGLHGLDHRLVYDQRPDEFEAAIRKGKAELEDLAGVQVTTYRAPCWSITRRSLWALDRIRAAGFEVDSSIFPTENHLYGIPDAPLSPYRLPNGLVEIPPSLATIAGKNVPFGGGFYLRAMPLQVTRLLMRRVLGEGRHVMLYAHPWEFDTAQPRNLPHDWKGRIIHYWNLRSTQPKLAALLREFGPFAPLPQSAAEAGPLLGTSPDLEVPDFLAGRAA